MIILKKYVDDWIVILIAIVVGSLLTLWISGAFKKNVKSADTALYEEMRDSNLKKNKELEENKAAFARERTADSLEILSLHASLAKLREESKNIKTTSHATIVRTTSYSPNEQNEYLSKLPESLFQ